MGRDALPNLRRRIPSRNRDTSFRPLLRLDGTLGRKEPGLAQPPRSLYSIHGA
jgi:hypothetical protein